MKIAFIGGGNMATALIGGLYGSQSEPEKIQVADPNPDVRQRLREQWPLTCFNHAEDAIADMDAVVLAVKPQILPAVLEQIGAVLSSEQLLISIVAGIPIKQIADQLPSSPAIIRTMPNMPALIGLGITALYGDENCSSAQRDMASKVMCSVGEVVWLEKEDLMDVVTAVSGSGPAYFFYLVEAMQEAGRGQGLPADIAEKLALHTANGACAMALQSDIGVHELRRRVTSRGGTTQAALDQLQAGQFSELVDSAIRAATLRGRQLATEGEQQ